MKKDKFGAYRKLIDGLADLFDGLETGFFKMQDFYCSHTPTTTSNHPPSS